MKNVITVLGVIALIVIIAVVFCLPTMWLWNWLMPLIFGLVKINIWQAMGINLLCTILFKSSYNSNKDK